MQKIWRKKNMSMRMPHLKTAKTAVMTSFNVFCCCCFCVFLVVFFFFEKMLSFCFIVVRVLYCNCNHSQQNRVLHRWHRHFDISVISVTLTAHFEMDDLNTIIFIIRSSKSIKKIIVLFSVFSNFVFNGFSVISGSHIK